MVDIPDIARTAALVGDPARAQMLLALKDDHVLSATELANVAGIAPNTASGHLLKLMVAGMVRYEATGRNRYYSLSCHEVAETLEVIEALTSKLLPRMAQDRSRNNAIRFARSCYDHLAGAVGVRLAQRIFELSYITCTQTGFALTDKGERNFLSLGIDIDTLKTSRRLLIRTCTDWSESCTHLGGALGAALLERFKILGWITKQRHSRALTITQRGKRGLSDQFGLSLD